jgi:hypothetical protein
MKPAKARACRRVGNTAHGPTGGSDQPSSTDITALAANRPISKPSRDEAYHDDGVGYGLALEGIGAADVARARPK